MNADRFEKRTRLIAALLFSEKQLHGARTCISSVAALKRRWLRLQRRAYVVVVVFDRIVIRTAQYYHHHQGPFPRSTCLRHHFRRFVLHSRCNVAGNRNSSHHCLATRAVGRLLCNRSRSNTG